MKNFVNLIKEVAEVFRALEALNLLDEAKISSEVYDNENTLKFSSEVYCDEETGEFSSGVSDDEEKHVLKVMIEPRTYHTTLLFLIMFADITDKGYNMDIVHHSAPCCSRDLARLIVKFYI